MFAAFGSHVYTFIHTFTHSFTHSYAYFAFDVGVWVVALELEVGVVEGEDVGFVGVELVPQVCGHVLAFSPVVPFHRTPL